MTTTTDLVTDVTSYLVTMLQAEAVPGGQLASVTVFDGPQPSAAATSLEQVLWVGHNPMEPTQEFGEAQQNVPFLGDHGRTQDEHGFVQMAAKHWTGDTTMSVHRAGAKAIVAAVEVLLRGDATSGGPGDYSLGGLVFWALATGPYTWWQQLIDDGAEAYCGFRITYYGRLVTA